MKISYFDLDPYGTAAPFIDSAIQCLEDDGMLLVTCTDAGVLAGSGYPEKCFALYGGIILVMHMLMENQTMKLEFD